MPTHEQQDRQLVTVSPGFKSRVLAWAAAKGIKGFSPALVQLAAIGLKYETGEDVPEPRPTWGGKREAKGDGNE